MNASDSSDATNSKLIGFYSRISVATHILWPIVGFSFNFLEEVSFWETVERFNANVAYSGLVHAVSQDVS